MASRRPRPKQSDERQRASKRRDVSWNPERRLLLELSFQKLLLTWQKSHRFLNFQWTWTLFPLSEPALFTPGAVGSTGATPGSADKGGTGRRPRKNPRPHKMTKPKKLVPLLDLTQVRSVLERSAGERAECPLDLCVGTCSFLHRCSRFWKCVNVYRHFTKIYCSNVPAKSSYL